MPPDPPVQVEVEQRIGSLLDTADQEPWKFYQELLTRDGPVWDEKMNAWLVASFAGCRHVLRNDQRLFHHPAINLPEDDDFRRIEGPLSIMMLDGDPHNAVHNWWLQEFLPKRIDRHRADVIQPLAHSLIDLFAGRGHAELSQQLVEPIPVRVIAVILGLPWDDDRWIARFKQLLDLELAYFDRARSTHGGAAPPDAEEAARTTAQMYDAVAEMRELMLPTIEARRRQPVDDGISRLWAGGPDLIEGFNVEHMLSGVKNLFFAGTDTTTHAICNGLHLLATRPQVAETVRAGGNEGLVAFGEEVLRLGGSVHFRARVCDVDHEVDGVMVRRGETVVTVNLAANRDDGRFPEPLEVDLARRSPQSHLAFNYGPRGCSGAPLARAEIQEVTRAVLSRLPHLRLDPKAEPPRFTGFLLRSYRPLNVAFDPT